MNSKKDKDISKVLVFGATGNQGGSVVRALLKKDYSIRAITRNLDSSSAKNLIKIGVEVLKGDFSDYDSLVRAATGMDTIYGMTTPFEGGIEEEVRQGKTIADVTKETSVGHLVFGSVASADKKTGIPHFDSKYEIEKYISTLDIPYTISAPVFFMDNHISPWSLSTLKEGKIKMAIPKDRLLQQVSVQNIGGFVAELIESREKVFGKRIDVAGDELTGEETASILSNVSSMKIVYEGFDPEHLKEQSNDMALMFEWFNNTGYSVDIKKLHKDYSKVNWQKLGDWANEQDWSVLW